MSEENHELMIQTATFLQILLVSEILAARLCSESIRNELKQ